jgi:hypothetical protein
MIVKVGKFVVKPQAGIYFEAYTIVGSTAEQELRFVKDTFTK